MGTCLEPPRLEAWSRNSIAARSSDGRLVVRLLTEAEEAATAPADDADDRRPRLQQGDRRGADEPARRNRPRLVGVGIFAPFAATEYHAERRLGAACPHASQSGFVANPSYTGPISVGTEIPPRRCGRST